MIARILAASCISATLLISAPLTLQVQAQEKKAASKSVPSKSGLRECRAKGQGGKILTWKCKAEQPCCYNSFSNIGVCGSPVIGCF